MVELAPDPPLARVDAAAFAAKSLAWELHAKLARHGYGYDRLVVQAVTESGEELTRSWRLEGVDSAGVVDRVRWQLEGWLDGRCGLLPTGGLVRLALKADQVHPATGERLWGSQGQAAARAARGAERVKTLLGGDGVYCPVLQGGRDPRSRVRMVKWGGQAEPAAPVDAPWPGALPEPAPATVLAEPAPVAVQDESGRPLGVSAALELTGRPAKVGHALVEGWAGPWPVVERWWSAAPVRRVYMQVKLAGEPAGALLSLEGGAWRLEGRYD
jgi:protein ImuB